VQLTLGADFPASDYLTNTSTAGATALAATPTRTTPVSEVPATAIGSAAPVPTDLSRMTASDIPWVN
jgi:hypothetical protein